MLERILLDANTILNATFVPGSWSRLIVVRLREHDKALFVGSRTLSEAVHVARSMASELGKQHDPAINIEAFIRRIGAIEVHPSEKAIEAAVLKHDHHVVQEATTAGATILTSDPELWLGCQATGHHALVPLEALRFLDGMALATTAFGVTPSRARGTVFARAYPGTWAGLKDTGQFTIIEFPGRFWLRYCAHERAWIVDMPEVDRLTLRAEMEPNVMQTVAVSWKAGRYLRLRVAIVEHPTEIPMPEPLRADLTGPATIGIHSSHEHSWSGAINVCVINDRPLSSALWARLRPPSPLTPNPYDDDRLRQAIAILSR